MDVQSYHHDEAVTAARILPVGFGEMLELVVESERSSHLYYVLAWLWTRPFGVGEIGLRSFSALVGTLTVAAAYFAGRELMSKRAGLIASALAAISPVLLWYSLEARSYGLLILFSALALGFCARSLRGPDTRALVLWASTAALALAAHYFAIFVIAPQAAWLLYRYADRARAIVASAGVGIAGLALLPLALAQQAGRGDDIFTNRSLAFRGYETAKTFMTGERPLPLEGNVVADLIQVAGTSVAVVLVAVGAYAALSSNDPVARRGGRVALTVGVSGVAIPFVLAVIGIDFVKPRNMLGSMVPLLCVAAIGFSVGPPHGSERARRRAVIAGLMLLIGAFTVVATAQVLSAQFQRDDWRTGAEAIGQATEPRVIVVNRNGDDPLLHYLDRSERFDDPKWDGGVRVRELVTLSKNHAARAPEGFRLVEEHWMRPRFVLYRFRAERPRHLKPRDVHRGKVLPERSLALIDGTATQGAGDARAP